MMAILLKGVKLATLSIGRDKENGALTLQGTYQLISNKDVVVATQTFNGYSDLKLEVTREVRESMDNLVSNIKKDLELLLGLREGGEQG